MRKTTLAVSGAALVLGSISALAAPAAAHHQHYIETPQGEQITLPCEPEGTAAYDKHPRHNQLHMGPSADYRAIIVASYGAGTCDDEEQRRPSGPARS